MDAIRKLPRLQKSLVLLLPDGWKGDVVDLSAVGMRVQSLLVLPEGAELEGVLLLPGGEQLPVKGEVVWTLAPDHVNRVPAEMGLELLDVSEAYLKALAGLFAD